MSAHHAHYDGGSERTASLLLRAASGSNISNVQTGFYANHPETALRRSPPLPAELRRSPPIAADLRRTTPLAKHYAANAKTDGVPGFVSSGLGYALARTTMGCNASQEVKYKRLEYQLRPPDLPESARFESGGVPARAAAHPIELPQKRAGVVLARAGPRLPCISPILSFNV